MRTVPVWQDEDGGQDWGPALPERFRALLPGAAASRRDFLRLMAASLALAGLQGCGDPPEEAVPYVRQPEGVMPGVARRYATAARLEGWALPVLATCHAGRPTKLDGNPDHPLSRGRSDVFTQAALLELYDPDRSRAPRQAGEVTSWEALDTALSALRARMAETRGAGTCLLTGTVTSPTLLRQLAVLQEAYPALRLYAFEPVGEAERPAALRAAFGRDVTLHQHLDRAAVIVSLEDDLLGHGPAQVRHAAGWGARRAVFRAGTGGQRLHVAESTPSLTGTMADRRLATPGSRLPALAGALAARLGLAESGPAPTLSAAEAAWVDTAAVDLRAADAEALVTAGAHLPPAVQHLALRLTAALGGWGTTASVTEPITFAGLDGVGTLATLADDIRAGAVQALVMLDCNPVYSAPADIDPAGMAGLLRRVALRVHAGTYPDETAALAHWHVPLAHALESWSDARALDGTATIMQPLIRPLFGGRSVHAFLAMLAPGAASGPPPLRDDDAGHALVRATWQHRLGPDFEPAWLQAVHDGVVPGTAAAPVDAVPRPAAPLPTAPAPAGDAALELAFRPDPYLRDGRFANSAWLQELPRPLTRLSWDNVVALSPAAAARFGIASGDVVEVGAGGRTARGPAWILPGQDDRTAAVLLGYGRAHAGRVGDKVGFSAYALRQAARPWRLDGATVARTGERHALASMQLQDRIEAADLIRTVAPDKPADPEPPRRDSLYDSWPYGSPSWGMAIDLDACIGCNACALACQAENNVPVVGKESVARGRIMHWLRIDRYYAGPAEAPDTHFQPVPCMHCEQAPCEMGCPVGATVHGPDGLNEMVYNRCVGTRTCSSYCPYKVRRFNWFDYGREGLASIKALRNPEVTVRARGVMEKCTYCVQRIAGAKVEAEKAGRPLRDGDVRTACQDACPTQAITFGDLGDRESAVSRAKDSIRNYALLGEQGTRPRTTYLARVRPDADAKS